MDLDYIDSLLGPSDAPSSHQSDNLLNLPAVPKNEYQQKTHLNNDLNVLSGLNLNDLNEVADFSKELNFSDKKKLELKTSKKNLEKNLSVFENLSENSKFGFFSMKKQKISDSIKNFEVSSNFEAEIDNILTNSGISRKNFENSEIFTENPEKNAELMKNKLREHYLQQKNKKWAKIKSKTFRKNHKKMINAQKSRVLDENEDISLQKSKFTEKIMDKNIENLEQKMENYEKISMKKYGISENFDEESEKSEKIIDFSKNAENLEILELSENSENQENSEIYENSEKIVEKFEKKIDFSENFGEDNFTNYEFLAEKDRLVEKESDIFKLAEKPENGWNSWGGAGQKAKKKVPEFIKISQKKQKELREKMQKSRKDFGKDNLIISAPKLSEEFFPANLPAFISEKDYQKNLQNSVLREFSDAKSYQKGLKKEFEVRRGFSVQSLSKNDKKVAKRLGKK